MFSKDDILKRLRDGAAAEDIANEMAENINGALKEFEDEQNKKKICEQEKMNDALVLIDAMNHYFGKYFGETMTAEQCEKAAKSLIKMTDTLVEVEARLGDALDKAKENRIPKLPALDDEIINKFLATL